MFERIAAVIAVAIVAIFFVWRFFPSTAQEKIPTSASTPKEKTVVLDRVALQLDSAVSNTIEQKLREAQAMKHHESWEAALKAFSHVVRQMPTLWEARWGQAYTKYKIGYDDAIDYFVRLEMDIEAYDSGENDTLVKMRAACFNQIAAIQDRMGKTTDAYESMKRAKDLIPGYPIYIANLIGLAVKADKESEARAWYKLLGDSPEGEGVLKNLSSDDLRILSNFPWFNITIH